MKKDLYIQTKIISHHHILDKDSFEYFMTGETLIEVSNVEERSFLISFYKTTEDTNTMAFYSKCHDIFSYFIIAINVATLGHFTWDFNFISPMSYKLVDKSKKTSHLIYPQKVRYFNNDITLKIEKHLIWRTLQLLLALGTERDDNFKKEYVKGLYNLHHSFFDIQFLNESFSNFYKAFEYFCTKKMLKLDKLTNEKKQLRKVLSDFGFEEDILENFDKIYIIRCNEAMHAQKDLASIDKEALIRIKIFLDSIMHKYYEPVWEKVLKKR